MNLSRKLLIGAAASIISIASTEHALAAVADTTLVQDQDILDAFEEVLQDQEPVAEPAPFEVQTAPLDEGMVDIPPMVDDMVLLPGHFVSTFDVRYTSDLAFLPNVAELYKIEIPLGLAADGYVGPGEADESVTIRLGEVDPNDPTRVYPTQFDAVFTDGALQTILQTIADALYAPQLTNYDVSLDPNDIDPATYGDRRPWNRSDLGIMVTFDGPYLPISSFELEYVTDAPSPLLPTPDELLDRVVVDLVPTGDGFVSYRPDVEAVPVRLSERVGAAPMMFSAGAVQLVLERITRELTRDFMGVRIVPARTDLGADPDGGLVDLRGDRDTLRLTIITGLVRDVRTLAVGERFDVDDRVNLPAHDWIRAGSPIAAPNGADIEYTTDLLAKRDLDEYLYLLSRHPGRRVDAAIARAPADVAGPLGVSLDYVVLENNPLLLYAQGSNTGTEQTREWRVRAGLFHNQLTGNDDVLSLEYVTADPDDTNSFSGSYEGMVFGNQRLRYRIMGGWSEYTASEVGFANLLFSGETSQVGAELAWNFHQDGQLFVDAVVGAQYMDIDVDNAVPFSSASEQFLLPYVGARLERSTETESTSASLIFDFNASDIVDNDPNQIAFLGRFLADTTWYTLKFNAEHSMYLEPLLDAAAWNDPSTPGSTLAHEIAFHVRGQYAFDRRLIPQMQQTAGGLFTVRGYDESVAVGDTVFLATAEYRFHLPQAMGTASDPSTFMGKPFRWVPQHAYGRADWDLIFRGFFDYGRVIQSERQFVERHRTLMGVGAGVQLLYRRNLDVRLDYGFTLEEIPGVVDDGSGRLHVIATILF